MKFFWLPSSPFSFHGRDAVRYLHARTTNNIQGLAIGDSCRAATLSPQGKTEGLFTILRTEAETFLVLPEAGSIEENTTTLKRFLVAEQVVVEPLEDFAALHLFGNPTDLPTSLTSYPAKRGESNGIDLIGKREDLEGVVSSLRAQEIDSNQQTLQRILGNAPAFPYEIRPERIYLETGPLDAISSTKGCYPGQEVIEKILSHGKTPRVLLRGSVQGQPDLTTTNEVHDASSKKRVGEVLSFAFSPPNDSTVLFFSVKPECKDSALLWGDTPIVNL